MNAAEYRGLAAWLRSKTYRTASGLVETDELNAHRLGAAQAVTRIAAERLERGESPAKVAAWLRREQAELEMSAEQYATLMIERDRARAAEYDARADEIDRAAVEAHGQMEPAW